MASAAARIALAGFRSGFASAFVLTVIAAAPWGEPTRERAFPAATIIGTAPRPLTIDVPDAHGIPNAWQSGHPDARPWPHGMVIGVPQTPDAITLWRGSPLDNILSVLVAPLAWLGA